MLLEKFSQIFDDAFQGLEIVRLAHHLSRNQLRFLFHLVGKPLEIDSELDFLPGAFDQMVDQLLYALYSAPFPLGCRPLLFGPLPLSALPLTFPTLSSISTFALADLRLFDYRLLFLNDLDTGGPQAYMPQIRLFEHLPQAAHLLERFCRRSDQLEE